MAELDSLCGFPDSFHPKKGCKHSGVRTCLCRHGTARLPIRQKECSNADQEKLFQVASLCEDAIRARHQRAANQGYGLGYLTEGWCERRIVGAAHLARKLMRFFSSGQADAGPLMIEPQQPVRR